MRANDDDADGNDAESATSSLEEGGGQHVRTVEARAEEARGGRDAGVIPAACDAMSLSLVTAALDEQCAVSEREWSLLSSVPPDAGAVSAEEAKPKLRQIARREGETILLSLINMATSAVIVPLRYHPDRPEKGFSMLAEDDRHAVFELAAPAFEKSVRSAIEAMRSEAGVRAAGVGARDASASAKFVRVHSARIRLAPGAAARVGLVVDTRITKRLDRSCGADGGADCAPSRLPKGRYTLHVGQLIADVDAGLPARVEWDVP